MSTALTILAWWTAASFAVAALWAGLRALGLVGFTVNRDEGPTCHAPWGDNAHCTRTRGHAGHHADDEQGISWPARLTTR